jgi:hypothetical protein
VQGAKDLQHIQYRELGKGLQVWEGERVWGKIARKKKAPASEGGRYKSWCNQGTGYLKDSCEAREKR